MEEIFYSLIAKNEKPLVEYSTYMGQFSQLCLNYLNKIEPNSIKAVNIDEIYMMYYINENDITFLIIAGKAYPKLTAIGCLQSIKTEFNQTYEGRDFDELPNYGLNDEFREKLRMKYDYFNENKDVGDEELQNIKKQLQTARDEMLYKFLTTTDPDKIKEMDNKAEKLAQDSYLMKKNAIKVRQTGKCKKYKKYAIIIGIVVFVLLLAYIIFGFTCGWAFGCFTN